MQAIDDYANENVARSIAYTVLEHRQQHNYSALLPLASRLLTQRIRFLGPPKTDNDAKEWDPLVQWQEDTCPQVIDSLWQSEEYQDKIYEQPVYYKRLDAETLHCVVEFAAKEGMRYAVVLVLEEGTGDISELKYHNTKAFTEKEWQQEIVKGGWSRSMEQAERAFIRIPGSSPPSPQDVGFRDIPIPLFFSLELNTTPLSDIRLIQIGMPQTIIGAIGRRMKRIEEKTGTGRVHLGRCLRRTLPLKTRIRKMNTLHGGVKILPVR